MRMVLFALLMTCAALSAASCTSDATQLVLSEQGVLLGIIIMLTIVVISLAYMIGSAIHNPNYIVFAKDELYHLGFSLLLLAGFSGVMVMSCEIMNFFYHSTFQSLGVLPSGCYSEGSGLNSVAACYVKIVKQDAVQLSKDYIKNHIDYLMDSTFSYSIAIPLFNAVTTVPGAYRRVISTQYDTILNMFLIPSLMSVSLQKLMLDFINENVIRWILPSAFVLRFFIPTRQMGNMIIALALALYVLVPFMYVFNLSMYDVVLSDCSKYAAAVCDNAVDNYSCAGTPQTTCDNPNSFWKVARLIPQAIFLPNLTIAVVITFLSAIHKGLRAIG